VNATPAGGAQVGASGRRRFEVRARTSAPVEVVWSLVSQGRRWKDWTFLDRSEVERTGEPDPDGVGAVRRFTRFGVGSREEVVAFEPPGHLGYTIRSGFPVRDYRADVVLEPDGSGTAIRWTVTFDEKWPGTGWLLHPVLHRIVSGFASGLARYAERVGGGGSPGGRTAEPDSVP
jgi:hypothetical protein